MTIGLGPKLNPRTEVESAGLATKTDFVSLRICPTRAPIYRGPILFFAQDKDDRTVTEIRLRPVSETPETVKGYLDEGIRRARASEDFASRAISRCRTQGRLTPQEAEDLFLQLRPVEFYEHDSDDARRRVGWAKPKELVEQAAINGELDGFVDDTGYVDARLVEQMQTVREIHVSVDFNSLFDALGQKGIVLQHLACPTCGGELPLPKTGSALLCTHCGNTIHATNMFEQFRGILGF